MQISRYGWVTFGVAILLWAAPVFGHKVTVFAWVENDTIVTESKYSAGKPVQNGKIEVYDPQGKKLLDGVTDPQGRFAFSVPQRSALKIVLVAGMGHGNHWWVRAEDIGALEDDAERPSARSTAAGVDAPPASSNPSASDCPDAQAIRSIVQQALEKKLAPIEARLAQPAWQWRDIVAGIGYILGLMGIAVLVRDRKKPRKA